MCMLDFSIFQEDLEVWYICDAGKENNSRTLSTRNSVNKITYGYGGKTGGI